jgi:hypothetical protein
MKFSTRFELIHLLGGKCLRCPQENMSELEIDHVYNDGDADRANHKEPYKRWLQMPILAKKRLQVLCKSCHVDKHNGFDSLEEKQQYDNNKEIYSKKVLQIKSEKDFVVETLKRMQDDDSDLQYFPDRISRKIAGVFYRSLIAELGSKDNEDFQQKWWQSIKTAQRECLIYESSPGCYKVV